MTVRPLLQSYQRRGLVLQTIGVPDYILGLPGPYGTYLFRAPYYDFLISPQKGRFRRVKVELRV